MDLKDAIKIGLALIATFIVGGTAVHVYDSGTEEVCRTNSPIGWEIISEHPGYYEAVCPYTTKAPEYQTCSSFRSTKSYQRYGCEVAYIFEETVLEPVLEEINDAPGAPGGSRLVCVPPNRPGEAPPDCAGVS